MQSVGWEVEIICKHYSIGPLWRARLSCLCCKTEWKLGNVYGCCHAHSLIFFPFGLVQTHCGKNRKWGCNQKLVCNVSIQGKRQTYYRQAHIYLALPNSCLCKLFCCRVLAVVTKFTWAMVFGGMPWHWGCHPGRGCRLTGVDFICLVGGSLSKLVVARVLLVICLRLGILSICEQSAWIRSNALAWAKITPAPSPESLDGKYLFSWGTVKLNEYRHGLLALVRVSPLFWPNVRNIKGVFRQWERKGLVWLTETVEQERRCFVCSYYG